MRKVWKWIIGIVVVLVIVAVVVGGVFMVRSLLMNRAAIARLNQPGRQAPGTSPLPFGNKGEGQRGVPWGFPGMRPNANKGWGGDGGYMRGPGMMGFGGRSIFGGLIGGLFCLGLLALIVLGIVLMARSLRKPAVIAAPVAPMPAASDVAPVSSMHSCSRCGEPVQDGWKHCPNCGKRQ
jgi:hypothetical protein